MPLEVAKLSRRMKHSSCSTLGYRHHLQKLCLNCGVKLYNGEEITDGVDLGEGRLRCSDALQDKRFLHEAKGRCYYKDNCYDFISDQV